MEKTPNNVSKPLFANQRIRNWFFNISFKWIPTEIRQHFRIYSATFRKSITFSTTWKFSQCNTKTESNISKRSCYGWK